MSGRLTLLQRLRRDRSGAGAVEFALVAPILFSVLIGVAQLGILFFANAGLHNAVAEGARHATIYPLKPNSELQALMTQKRFGLNPVRIVGPTITHWPDVDNDGVPDEDAPAPTYADISMSYTVPLNFVFFEVEPITLTETRRIYTQPAFEEEEEE